MDLKEESILGGDIDSHWCSLSKARALSSCLPRSTGNTDLDVRAGSGFFSRWLLSHGMADEATRSEEHTSDLQSLMRISYATIRFKKQLIHTKTNNTTYQ